MANNKIHGVGKRKESVARVYITKGTGQITVNQRTLDDYFKRPTLRMVVEHPLELTETKAKFDISVNVDGGGLSGQAGAIRHGLTRALMEYEPDFRGILKEAGLVTRDARIKERKMYGHKASRARFQFSKR